MFNLEITFLVYIRKYIYKLLIYPLSNFIKYFQAKATYGTGCFLLYNTGPKKIDSAYGLITTVAYKVGPTTPPIYALEGSIAVAGAALSWLKDNINILPAFNEAENIASQAKSLEEGEGDVYFVPAFSGLYAPYWHQDARG